MPNEEREKERVASFSKLDELVLFSPEIQRISSGARRRFSSECQWGDVFVKVEDRYPFAFTIYTVVYVRERSQFYGESIVPSSKDVLLRRARLTPQDIVRAAIKWVNLYFPGLHGKPILLEKEEVLRDLICDPGVEVIVYDPS
ncbi:MAG: hypothetical protein AB1640_23845 [bacterium]